MRQTNGWTGGQYSLYRAVLGTTCGVLAAGTDAPLPFRLAATAVSLLLAVGIADHVAAAVLWFLMAWHAAPHGLGPRFAAVLWLLLLHLGTRRHPYGAFAMRGRLDPGSGWQLRPLVATLAWLGLAVAHVGTALTTSRHGGLPDTAGALRILAALLLLPRTTRRWAWLALATLVAVQAIRGPVEPEEALAIPAWFLLHLAAFDPAWLPARRRATPLQVYYDGHCGLCHRFVRFCLAEDPNGDLLRYAPLQGDTYAARVPEQQRAGQPDSVVVQDGSGPLRVRSTAAVAVLDTLGGLWRVVAALFWLVPRPLRDLAYDGIARIRKRLFATPAEACPILPPPLRTRFLP